MELWHQGLTRREQDVVALSCLGFTNEEIAGRLGIAGRQ